MWFAPLVLLVIIGRTCAATPSESDDRIDGTYEKTDDQACDENSPEVVVQGVLGVIINRNIVCNSEQPIVRRDDYNYSSVGAHKLHTVGLSWNEARKVCVDEGADLAVINSIAEAEWLKSMLEDNARLIHHEATELGAWIGVHDYYSSREWVTVFSKSLASAGYTKWRSDCPSGNASRHCVYWDVTERTPPDYGLTDAFCRIGLAFICELGAMIA